MVNARQFLVVAVLFFSAATVALPQSLPAPKSDLHVSNLVIPHELGHISQVHEVPNATPSTKLLILIQDAHVNYEAQKHLAAILDRLASTYGIGLILVEGGEGDVSLSYLRGRGSKAVREQVAEEHLRTGILSGEEYLDIVSDHPLVLWGVDDPLLYDTHVKMFLELERARETVGEDLARLRQLAERLRSQDTNEALRTFEATQALFDAGTLEFGEYLRLLLSDSARVGVEIADSPNLSRVVSASQLEAQMKPEQVAQEQQQAVTRLRRRVPEQELASLRDLAGKLKAGQVESAAFYRKLESLLHAANIDLAGFPQLAQYVRYVQLKAGLETKPLWAELAELQRRIKARLVLSSDEGELASLADRIALCERLIRLAWTPDDDQVYSRQPDQIRASQWLPALRTRAARQGVAWDWAGDAAALDEQLARAVRFYEIAHARDAEIVRRALSKMDAEGQRVAVLIAGGFHTDDLIDRLARQPVHVAVVTPVVTHDEGERRYVEILAAKYGEYQKRRTSLAGFERRAFASDASPSAAP